MLPQDGADVADHTGLVAVSDDDEGACQRRLDLDAVQQHEAWLVRFEDRALGPPFSAARMQLD